MDVSMKRYAHYLKASEMLAEKIWYESKTVWFNVAVAMIFLASVELLDLQRMLSMDRIEAFIVLASSVGNILLRFGTKKRVRPRRRRGL